jgi:hypothetical protein
MKAVLLIALGLVLLLLIARTVRTGRRGRQRLSRDDPSAGDRSD